jgi:aminoglycoside phosphotransferase
MIVDATTLAPDDAIPERDALLGGDPTMLPIPTSNVDVVRCKYRVGESLRVVYRCDGGQLVSVRAGAGQPPRWWVFPDDRRLPRIAELLAPGRALRAASGNAWVRSDVAEYAPERSITVRARDVDGRIVAYAKQYAPGTRDVAALARRYDSVARHLGGGSPRALGRCGDVLVLEAIAGRPWADIPSAEADAVVHRLGRAIAAMHGAAVPMGTPAFDRLAPARLIASGEAIARARPDVGGAVGRIVGCLVVAMVDEPSVLLHGDCHPKNAIVDGDRVALIDLDQAGTGPAAADIASLLARLCVGTLVGRHAAATEHALADAFLAGYDTVRPLPPATSLRWHVAGALIGEQAIRAVNRVRPDVLAVLPQILTAARDLFPGGRP